MKEQWILFTGEGGRCHKILGMSGQSYWDAVMRAGRVLIEYQADYAWVTRVVIFSERHATVLRPVKCMDWAKRFSSW